MNDISKSVTEKVAPKAAEIANKVVEKGIDIASKMDDKDKAEIVEQVNDLKDAGQKKASDILKTADKILNSPEANIIGDIAGDKVKDKLKSGQKIVGDLSHNPMIVGKNAFAEFQGQREH